MTGAGAAVSPNKISLGARIEKTREAADQGVKGGTRGGKYAIVWHAIVQHNSVFAGNCC